MKTWMVTYQDVPYRDTNPASLVLEAPDINQAFATAYDHLTRQGKVVDAYSGSLKELGCDEKAVHALGVLDPQYSLTHIRSIVEYVVQATGKVLKR